MPRERTYKSESLTDDDRRRLARPSGSGKRMLGPLEWEDCGHGKRRIVRWFWAADGDVESGDAEVVKDPDCRICCPEDDVLENPGELRFLDETSPLDYHGHRPQRLSLVDPSAPPPDPRHSYFAETQRTIRTGAGGRTLKKPRVVIEPGASPGVVAFVDYDAHLDHEPWPGVRGQLSIHYVTTRADQRGKGHMKRLLDELIARNIGKVGYVDFGDVHDEHVGRYVEGIRPLLEDEGKQLRARRRFNPAESEDPFQPIETARNTYEVCDWGGSRVICGSDGVGLDKTGMPAYDLSEIDPELKGFYGVHVGDPDAWLPILSRDGYCSGDAYVYEIDAAAAEDDGIPFWFMEDPHVVDKTEAPSSQIVFSRLDTIPPKYVRLVEVIPHDEVVRREQEAFDDEFVEDDDEFAHGGEDFLGNPRRGGPEQLESLRPEFARAAQKVYDEWQQDAQGYAEGYGAGGICHDIASAFVDVLGRHGIDGTSFNFTIDENHVTAVADIGGDAWRVDILPGVYEEGGGYTWRKLPDVVFDPSDILIESMGYPFNDYIEG